MDENCNIKLGGFSRARTLHSPDSFSSLPYSTYLCPEALYKSEFFSYAKAGDMWSIGCVFAEMIRRTPLFTAIDKPNLLKQIFAITQCQPDLHFLNQHNLQSYVAQQTKSLENLVFNSSEIQGFESEFDLLCKLLIFDPARRINSEEALKHACFQNTPYMMDHHKLCTVGSELKDNEIPYFIHHQCGGN